MGARIATGDRIGFGRGLGAGAAAGVLAAIGAVLAHLVVSGVTGRSYAQLSVVTIPVATMVAALLGGLVFVVLARRVRRHAAAFAVLAAIGATADTMLAMAAGQGVGFVVEAGVLHVVVATVVAVLLPRFALSRG